MHRQLGPPLPPPIILEGFCPYESAWRQSFLPRDDSKWPSECIPRSWRSFSSSASTCQWMARRPSKDLTATTVAWKRLALGFPAGGRPRLRARPNVRFSTPVPPPTLPAEQDSRFCNCDSCFNNIMGMKRVFLDIEFFLLLLTLTCMQIVRVKLALPMLNCQGCVLGYSIMCMFTGKGEWLMWWQ